MVLVTGSVRTAARRGGLNSENPKRGSSAHAVRGTWLDWAVERFDGSRWAPLLGIMTLVGGCVAPSTYLIEEDSGTDAAIADLGGVLDVTASDSPSRDATDRSRADTVDAADGANAEDAVDAVITPSDVAPCRPEQAFCLGVCADLATSADHCGKCFNACVDGAVCVRGNCVGDGGVCPPGRSACPEGCLDLQTDPLHCGECANACVGGAVCLAGNCVRPGSPDAGMDAGRDAALDVSADAGADVRLDAGIDLGGDLGVDAPGDVRLDAPGDVPPDRGVDAPDAVPPDAGVDAACGPSCDVEPGACPRGLTRCDEVCVDTETDPTHCGECFNACAGSPPRCARGGCLTVIEVCPRGLTLCNDRCVDTESDGANCGKCGNLCASGRCARGGCR